MQCRPWCVDAAPPGGGLLACRLHAHCLQLGWTDASALVLRVALQTCPGSAGSFMVSFCWVWVWVQSRTSRHIWSLGPGRRAGMVGPLWSTEGRELGFSLRQV